MNMFNRTPGRQEPYTAHELIETMAKTVRKEVEIVRGLSTVLAACQPDDTKGAEFKAKADVQVREMEIAASMIESLLQSKS